MKRRSDQPDLFDSVELANGLVRVDPPLGAEPVPKSHAFDFLASPDVPRCVPRPDWVVSEELKLPTDDANWMPEGRFG